MASIYLPFWESASVFLPLRAGKFFLAEPLFDQAGFRGNAGHRGYLIYVKQQP
jgi:hypothetical protein